MKILIFSFFIAFFIFNESAFALSRLTQSFQRSDPKPDPKKTSQPPATQTGSSTQTTTTPPQTGSSTTTLSNPTATEPAQPFASVVEERDWSTSPTLPPRESQYYYTQRIDTLTPEQRKNLHEQHLNANCVNKTSENVSCGYREKWSHRGDPYFTWDPYMNQIKPETPVDIEVKCNPKTKRFVTNISINQCTQSGDKEVCKKKYFSNPYFNCAKNGPWETCEENFVSSKEVFSDQPQNWLTSPGIYLGHMKTNLPSVISRTEGGNSEVKLVAQEQRIVGSGALYQGARVPNVLWLSNNGNAFHGSQCVDGRPQSQGCLRLSQGNAMALYRLARRVGSKNFTVKWKGYGPIQDNGRPLCAQSAEWNKKAALHFAQRFKNGANKQAATDLEKEIYRLAELEGRTRMTTNPEVDTTDSTQ